MARPSPSTRPRTSIPGPPSTMSSGATTMPPGGRVILPVSILGGTGTVVVGSGAVVVGGGTVVVGSGAVVRVGTAVQVASTSFTTATAASPVMGALVVSAFVSVPASMVRRRSLDTTELAASPEPAGAFVSGAT